MSNTYYYVFFCTKTTICDRRLFQNNMYCIHGNTRWKTAPLLDGRLGYMQSGGAPEAGAGVCAPFITIDKKV
jgi:hypothetical protein